jgi:crotonobetainyl-CoA:carnitine CoA-transferase CaiB-like acyl-CoA transferase
MKPAGLYRRERTGEGSYVTTSLLAEGVWSASVAIEAALCESKWSKCKSQKLVECDYVAASDKLYQHYLDDVILTMLQFYDILQHTLCIF